ncbi:phage tail protein [Enterobacteriaceae bacterium 4M9]|nr:phage tail protein [Enterobacteriaceae bacterium 4M9]
MTKYYATLTTQGAARLANATALGQKLSITQMAVGDGGGVLPMPDPAQTALINQKRIAPLNSLGVDPNNAGQIIAEQIIPENEGGFWVREVGLYDDNGILIAVGNCPETYKPQLAEGSGRTQTIRMVLAVSAISSITLKIDPAVVLATREYVDKSVSGLGLDTGATMPAASGLGSTAGYISVPGMISGVRGNMLIQWKSVSVTQSPDGSMVPVEGTWPVAFPNACLSINPSLTNSLIYAVSGAPFVSAAIVDRARFKAACAYNKSNSTVTVWGVGY